MVMFEYISTQRNVSRVLSSDFKETRRSDHPKKSQLCL